MKVKIMPGKGQGKLSLPSSKSLFHRALFCAALAKKKSTLFGRLAGEDLLATRAAVCALGGQIDSDDECVTVDGADPFSRSAAVVDCASSATTLRLGLPLFLLSGETVRFLMSDQLAARPLSVYGTLLKEKGISMEECATELCCSGRLTAGEYRLPGDVSSQFISGLLLALPLLEGDSTIRLTTPLESAPYVEMTRKVQKAFSVETEETRDGYFIRGDQRYQPTDFTVEGDATIASVYETLNAFGSLIFFSDAPALSLQGDARFPVLLEKVRNHETVDLTDTPDLAPQLFALAAFCGEGSFVGTRRLSFKESDRATSMKEELLAFGVDLRISQNEVFLKGELRAPSHTLVCHNDHRIAMALATLLTRTGGILDGAECVAKSYPDFWRDLNALGFAVEEI